MKKPKKVQGEFIPRSERRAPTNSRGNHKSNEIDINGMLAQLDGAQIKEIAENVIGLATNGIELGKEYLKTIQVVKNSEAEIEKSRNEFLKVREIEITKRVSIDKEVRNNEHHFSLGMKKENDNHTQIMKILDCVEKGKISSEQLESIIFAVKSGAN
ncbi:TPA: hypothetical protein I7285_05715 [Vibrio parahaemolyticus]|nr:hypothetical protein [Vibrio parahaemolyticus]HAS6904648.1 hypothetical protein [Vibrio parahaemolyticus]